VDDGWLEAGLGVRLAVFLPAFRNIIQVTPGVYRMIQRIAPLVASHTKDRTGYAE
jgi:hypothetical protein